MTSHYGSEACRVCVLRCCCCLVGLHSGLAYSGCILGVFPFPSHSHQVVYHSLVAELARRGHHLVVVTPSPVDGANYTQVDVSTLHDVKRRFSWYDERSVGLWRLLFAFGDVMCEAVLSHGDVRASLDERFDAVLVEWVVTPCVVALGHRLSAPVIGVSSFPPTGVLHDAVGNPSNPAYIPEVTLQHTDRDRGFLQRAETLLFDLRMRYLFYREVLPRQDAIVKKHLGASTPYIGDLQARVSLLLLNVIQGLHGARPSVPAVVYVDGLHIAPPKPLPQDVKQFLDSSHKGAIYLSLGSNIRSDQMSSQVREAFLLAFAELKEYNVLWKWESDHLPGRPDNVMAVKWAPQQDVLGHPNVRAFITQGGLQSIDEAIRKKVPFIGVPFVSDQHYNTKLAVERGVAVQLDRGQLTKSKIVAALKTIIQDSSYKENMERLSSLVEDQLSSPMERAVWWTEYVLRHRGAYHLRSAAVDMPWYSYLLLDVYLFLLCVVLMTWYTTKFLYRLATSVIN